MFIYEQLSSFNLGFVSIIDYANEMITDYVRN